MSHPIARPTVEAPAGAVPPAEGLPGLAVFDFDGTLVRGDSLLPFLARVAGGKPCAATWPAAPRGPPPAACPAAPRW
ncbi:hypothetical protein [Nitrospirillum sp. BR 11828]|uniref:hypothetical protein n=1 Tax=Nitrospirillum sp. BR 11828 TaxID=3104325 RepID=UPI002ACA6A95|nr:hypothetical protein [Nitrospirillum sp. BR 11828]MDZ5646987.1 hypothetical protein [Nitrospirillum sp. BR 11828]